MNYRLYLLLILPMSFWSCKSLELKSEEARKRLPDRWQVVLDSSAHSRVTWRAFFEDEKLRQLIDSALLNNFDALTALQRIEASRANVRLANGALLPTVGANATIAQRRYGLYTMDGAGNATTPINGEELIPVNLPDFYIGLQTSWEVDIWGKLKARRVSSLGRYLSTVEGRNLVVTNLVADVASSYYELVSLDAQLAIVRETISLQQNALELTRTQQEAGVINKLAVQQVEAQLLSSKSLEQNVMQNIVELESRINFLLGRYPMAIERSNANFLLTKIVNPDIGVPSDLLRYRPDIREAEYELLSANADVKSAQRAFLPSFNITGAYGFQAYKTSFLFNSPESIAYGIIGGLAAPMVNRSAIKAEFSGAKAAQLEAYYNYQKSIINGYCEVYNQISNIRRLDEAFELKAKQVQLLTESIETSTELFNSRRANYLEVILAQRNSLEAKLELVELKRGQLLATINLYKALGGGWMQ